MENNDMDATLAFAHKYAQAKYNDIPIEEVEFQKKQFLDTLGTTLGGSDKPGIKELLAVVKKWGGKRQSSILDYGIRVPAPNAAQVNATMAHALDYDNGDPEALVHTGCVVVPTCLAVAEQKGGVTGKEYITAATLGTDIMCRLGIATRPNGNVTGTGWHFTMLYGFLGASVIAGKILGLNEDQILNAMGIAYHQSAGNLQCVSDGALTKRMGPGFAAKGGITSALMAEQGITGAKHCLGADYGLYSLYHYGDYDNKILVQDLGKVFRGVNVGFKPYPCCGITHVYIDAMLELVNQYKIKPSDVDSILLIGGEAGRELCTPLEIKRKPRNYIDAQFSLPWTVATAIVIGKPCMEHFTEESIQNENILNIAQKIDFEYNPKLTSHGAFGTGIVRISTKKRKVFTKQVDYPLGSPERPLSFDDCAQKFFDCASYAIKPISKDKLERIVELTKQLELLNDLDEIIQLIR